MAEILQVGKAENEGQKLRQGRYKAGIESAVYDLLKTALQNKHYGMTLEREQRITSTAHRISVLSWRQ